MAGLIVLFLSWSVTEFCALNFFCLCVSARSANCICKAFPSCAQVTQLAAGVVFNRGNNESMIMPSLASRIRRLGF